jgi:septum formation protein
MESIKYNLVLGSGSPRRKELLSHLGIDFVQLTADLEEVTAKNEPRDIVIDLAVQKAKAIIEKGGLPDNPLLITSDTIVVFENEILGKPESKSDARSILSKLSGNTHEVYTGVVFYRLDNNNWKQSGFATRSEVSFNTITDDLMNLYLESDEAMDKAGAYGIQGQGLIFVDKVVGSYSNVVGFPLSDTIIELKRYLKVPENTDLREYFHHS